jgi:hypothetical protein
MRAPTPHAWQSWPTSAEPWFRARAFGVAAEDLGVDFHGQARPLLLTQLLGACLRRLDDDVFNEDELWSWTLTRRLQGLLAIVAATGVSRLDAVAHCPQASCGEAMELPMPLSSFCRSEDIEAFDWTVDDGVTVNVAMPTGADQLHWLNRPALSTASMAQRLLRGDTPALSADALDRLSAAFEEKDPFTALQLNAQCPACAAAVAVDFDLEAELLRRLDRFQTQRLREIHLLASTYHWSETEIMNLPPWRRAHYLRQAAAERPS